MVDFHIAGSWKARYISVLTSSPQNIVYHISFDLVDRVAQAQGRSTKSQEADTKRAHVKSINSTSPDWYISAAGWRKSS
jgi:hypothetical protein